MVSNELSMVEKIRANAGLVVSIAWDNLDVDLDFDEEGVEWLDGYIERQRSGLPPEKRSRLVGTLGSYLGECIIHSFGGEWVEVDGRWGIRFDERHAAFPFAKVEKHLQSGPEDSVLSFFRAIPVLFQRQ